MKDIQPDTGAREMWDRYAKGAVIAAQNMTRLQHYTHCLIAALDAIANVPGSTPAARLARAQGLAQDALNEPPPGVAGVRCGKYI